jgi:regulator of protease activity HflC (stomatin/prohibitin superfamily)
MASAALSRFENDSPATSSGDRDVLRRLLKVESEAAVLVDDAQAEADRRVAEGEKESRARYDEQYSQEAARLDEDYAAAVLAIKEEYQKQLDAYRKSLDAMPVRKNVFFALVERLFFEGC